jgi:hypothetical protein
VSLYAHVRDLPLEIEGYALEGLELQARPDFLRKTTVVHLRGGGQEGIGEDVTYTPEEHERLQARGDDLPLTGTWTLHGLSEHLATLPLFDSPPEQPQFVDYRRWAFESAALDLALRQAGMSLGEAVGRTPRPLAFVVSMGLGSPPSLERVRAWLDLYPGLRFKLDATPEWTEELFSELAASGVVDSIDLKGHYRGTIVDNPPDPELYLRVAKRCPRRGSRIRAHDETTAVLSPRDQVTGMPDPPSRTSRGSSGRRAP